MTGHCYPVCHLTGLPATASNRSVAAGCVAIKYNVTWDPEDVTHRTKPAQLELQDAHKTVAP